MSRHSCIELSFPRKRESREGTYYLDPRPHEDKFDRRTVIPVKTGIQKRDVDSRFRGNDRFQPGYEKIISVDSRFRGNDRFQPGYEKIISVDSRPRLHGDRPSAGMTRATKNIILVGVCFCQQMNNKYLQGVFI